MKTVTIAGATKYIPTSKDEDWSRNFHDWATALSSAAESGRLASEGQTDITYSSGTLAISPSLGPVFRVLVVGDIATWTIAAGTAGQKITIIFQQDDIGKVVSGYPANAAFAGGAFALGAAEQCRDTISFVYDATISQWLETGRALNSTQLVA